MQPGDINLLNSLGVALAEVNRHREAIDCFSKVLEYKPDNHMALVNKGMSCRLIGRDDEAVHCFEKALQCTDHMEQASLELYLQLSRLYCMQEQYDNAVTLLNQWQEAKGVPEEFMFFRLMGEACMGAGRNRDAILALQHSLKLHPRNAESLSMLGLLYVLEGQGAEVGLSLCNRAIGMDETEAEYYYRLASALFHLDRFTEALPAVRSALKIRRNHDRAVLLRGRIYEGMGRVHQARQSYQRVVAMKTAGNGRKSRHGQG
jgi:Flp pilus assembly protein TadD